MLIIQRTKIAFRGSGEEIEIFVNGNIAMGWHGVGHVSNHFSYQIGILYYADAIHKNISRRGWRIVVVFPAPFGPTNP
jgi:hypothetical protein